MTERPILFSAPMVRALLAGEKTQTRRAMIGRGAHKGSNFQHEKQWCRIAADGTWIGWTPGFSSQEKAEEITQRTYQGGGIVCPHGVVGDRLWVKETHQYADWTEDGMPWLRYAADGATRFFDSGGIPESWGDKLTEIFADLSDPANVAIDGKAADRKWRPSIFMPRWASRITLEITDVRVQRLWDISEADALAEGVYHDGQWFRGGTHPTKGSDQCWPTAWAAYRAIWDTINSEGAWDRNPWVWCLSFRMVRS